MRLEDEHVGEVGEGGAVGHHTRETDLLCAAVHPEDHRVLNRTLDDLEGNIGTQYEFFKKSWTVSRSGRETSVLITYPSCRHSRFMDFL